MRILISGASRGLGAAAAEALAVAGHTVYAGMRRLPEVPMRDGIMPVLLDVDDPVSINAALRQIEKDQQGLDVLVNNAGVSAAGPLEGMDLQQARALFDTNVWGAVSLMQAALPLLRRSRGRIINITSIAAEIALPYRALYSASKAALSSFTQGLRLEVKPFGVDVCEIQPGDFRTDIFANAQRDINASKSCYQEDYARRMSAAATGMQQAPEPPVFARALLQLIDSSSLPPVARCGDFLQRMAPRIKGVLPGRLFEALLMRFM